MKSPRRTTLALSVLAGAALSSLSVGCAGVKNPPALGGGGGSGTVVTPPIPGLVSIDVAPPTQTISLTASAGVLSGSASYTAMGHFMDGHTEDVTNRVNWSSQFSSLRVAQGSAMVSAPGVYTINVASGTTVTGSAMLTATFTGSRYSADFNPGGTATLDAPESPVRPRWPTRWTARSSRRT